MRKVIYLPLLAWLVILAGCRQPHSHDQQYADLPERPSGRVVFYNASFITDIQLVASIVMRRAEDLTGIEFAMVLLPTIPENYSLETYAADLFDHWRIGENHAGRGVLFLFAVDEAALKIEVSYELEPVFPDAFCNSYQEIIKMYFASEHFGDVVEHSINNMVKRYLGEPIDADFSIARTIHSLSFSRTYLSGGGGIRDDRYFLNKQERLAEILAKDPSISERYPPTESIHETFWNWVRSLEDGINFPHLDILKQGGHYMRYEYPEAPRFLQNEAATIRAALPYEVHTKGDLAAIRFSQAAAPNLYFRRGSDGKWRHELVKTWALSQGSYDFTTYSVTRFVNEHPWDFAFPDRERNPVRLPSPRLMPEGVDVLEEMDRLNARIQENPSSPENYAELANLLFWELYWIKPAIEVAEAGLERDPANIPLRWLAVYARYRAPLLDGVEPHYIALVRETNGAEGIFEAYEGFIESTSSDPSTFRRLAGKYGYEYE